ncbi:MAG TPA: hypothetical protein VGM98_16955 [Schlesneria sp.]|jgi:hypothetical protein
MNEVKLAVSNHSSSVTTNEATDGAAGSNDITLGRLSQFLLGSRPAILTFASRGETFWLGLVLVISAGFVREYRQINWLHNPWLIALPLIMTVALSLVLFPLVVVVARKRGATDGNYWERYRVFLSLFWMTAPLAWIFIIPVEQLMSADDAAIIKLWFLGIVSLWRVFLVTRILSTLFVPRASEMFYTGTFFILMLVLDTLLLCRFRGDRPVLMVGSAIEAPAVEFLIVHVMAVIVVTGMITWPIWLVGTLMVALGEGSQWAWAVKPERSRGRFTLGVKLLATASLLIWVLLIPIAQPSQQGPQISQPGRQIEPLPRPVELNASRTDRLH